MKPLLPVFNTAIALLIGMLYAIPSCQSTAQQFASSTHTIASSSGQTALSENSFTANPALCGRIDSGFVAASFVPSRFGMSELQYAELLIGNKLSERIGAMAGITGLGNNELYNELSALIGVSARIGESFIIGSAAHYDRLTVKDFPSASSTEINVGGLLVISKDITTAATFTNILRESYATDSRIIRQTVLIGIGAALSSSFSLDADAVVSLNQYSGISFAARYNIMEYLRCRLAVSTAPRSAEIAVAIHPIQLCTILAKAHYHDVLGISQQFSLLWYW
jgi:hypothetical protein